MSDHSIVVVIDVFLVIIGVAVERFLTKFPLGRYDPAFLGPDCKPVHNKMYWLCYLFSLAAIVTLVLRFLIGSDSQLRDAYIAKPGSIDNFVWDVCALMLFGGFIVKAALAHDVRWFAAWLAWCSAVGVCWSVFASFRGDPPALVFWWLKINSVQFLITLAVSRWCKRCKKTESRKFVIWALLALSAWYIGIFAPDMHHILRKQSAPMLIDRQRD